ncbi:hypothetical protein [Paracoccus aminovorans]|uniref:hypothetical protein n=1 Tax=Paracoccus aminovorans TaxID=34004 RepID=UPI0011137CB6|nr:hypothetical protein [Paracoccus aminovorans]
MAKAVFNECIKAWKSLAFLAPPPESPTPCPTAATKVSGAEKGDASAISGAEWGTKAAEWGTVWMSLYTIDTVFSLMIEAGKTGCGQSA